MGRRYEGYGWRVERVDGHDQLAIAGALEAAVAEERQPTLVVCRTHIAYGAPTKQDSAESHGAPLGAEERAAANRAQDWPLDPPFFVPDEVRAFFRARAEDGAALRAAWDSNFGEWREKHPERAAQWDVTWKRSMPEDLLDRLLGGAPAGAGATRAHGAAVLQQAARLVPALVGGSADLAPSWRKARPAPR